MMDIIAQATPILDEAFQQHRPSHAFALFSGGHDSLAVTSVAMRYGGVDAVVHVNTGIGIEATRAFVRETCREQGWPLIELHPPALTYDEMVLRHGFPGPAQHLYPYVWLKDRALRKLVREHRVGDKRILFISGVRQQESARRMGHVQPILKEPSSRVVWVAPLTHWSAHDVRQYVTDAGLKRNRVVDLLHMSGECLCGAFAREGEIEFLEAWFPEVGQRIHDLERRAAAAGVHCVWGTRPPKFYTELKAGQLGLPTMAEWHGVNSRGGSLCWSCSRRSDDVA